MSTEDLFNKAFTSLEEKSSATAKEAAAKTAPAAPETKKNQLTEAQRAAREYGTARKMLSDIFSTVVNDLNAIPVVCAKNLQFSMTLQDQFTGKAIYDNNEDGWGHIDYCKIGIDCADEHNTFTTVVRFNATDYSRLEVLPAVVTDQETRKQKFYPISNPDDQAELAKTLINNAAAYIHKLG